MKSTMCLFYNLSHVFSDSLEIGGWRHEGAARWNIRRPLRSNGQRVVNHTQKLSAIPFCKCKYSETCSASY